MDVTAERCLRKLNDLIQSVRRLNVSSVYQYSLVDTRDSINDVHCSVQFPSAEQGLAYPEPGNDTMPRRTQGHKEDTRDSINDVHCSEYGF